MELQREQEMIEERKAAAEAEAVATGEAPAQIDLDGLDNEGYF